MLTHEYFSQVSLQMNMLAQAAAPEKITTGQAISAVLVLMVMGASIWMIIVWNSRRNLTGHALPAAQRGVLRVPQALTYVGIGLAILMFLLVVLVSMQADTVPPVAPLPAGTAAQAEATPAAPADAAVAAEPATTPVPAAPPASDTAGTNEAAAATPVSEVKSEGTSDAAKEATVEKKSAASQMSPESMRSALLSTVVMDAFLFTVLGIVVFASRSQGRVRLPESGVPFVPQQPQTFNPAMFSQQSFWPDLDDQSATPHHLGIAMWSEPASSTPSAPPRQNVNGSLAEDSSSYGSQTVTGPDGMPVTNPFDVEESASPLTELVTQEEKFSWLTEWRFAGETFLAAYVPTAVLRIVVVLMTEGLTGETPEQHPFLEMMENGSIGFAVLSLILLTAVFLAPIVEELQFRVVMLGGLAQLGHPGLALTISSVLFASVHGFPDGIALLPLAFALGYTYLRRRSYITVMMVHFLFNGFNMLLAFAAMV